MLVDGHTHLDQSEQAAADLVAAAELAGVGLIIQSGINLETSLQSVRLAHEFPQVFASVGYHPQESGEATDEGFAEIERLTADPKVIAVGETGFDYFHDRWPHELQESVFIRHIDLARRAELPVVIHTRDAAADTLRVLAEHAAGLTVVLHCFSLPNHLDELLDRGYYLSFAGNVTYKSATDLQDCARAVPGSRLLLETDAPWLTPVPHRGKPNSPALVAKVYEFVAALRGGSVDELAAQIEANVLRAYPRVAEFRVASGAPTGAAEPRPRSEPGPK